MEIAAPDVHPLQQRRPGFLDLLEEDPERARNEIWDFVFRFFKATPPRFYRRLSVDEREECVHNVYILLTDAGFKKLRMYKDAGPGFGAWLNRVAGNWIADYLRAKGREPEPEPPPRDDDGPERDIPDPAPLQADAISHRRTLDIVNKALATLGDMCRFLIHAYAEGRKPLEIALMLGRAKTENKDISEQHRQCLKKLKELVTLDGGDLSPYQGRRPK